MLKLYTKNKSRQIISDNGKLIDRLCHSCHLPSDYLRAVLLMEIPEIDLYDIMADTLVRLNWLRYSVTHHYACDRHTHNLFRKYDSSTGYGQIYSQVAIEAILFARTIGIPTDPSLSSDLSPLNPDDLKIVWLRLHRDSAFNLQCSALNIIHAAYQMTGRVDFDHYSEDEKKMIFSRYNGNAERISAYGRKAYQYYLEYAGQHSS